MSSRNPAAPLRSALYHGVVVHDRPGPAGLGPQHRFRARLSMLLLDLEETAALAALHPLWRAGPGPGIVRLQRADLPGERDRPAPEALRQLVRDELGLEAPGPIQVLFHPRTWGWLFNPISCAYLHDGNGQPVAMVAEVTNTPWHERQTYVLGPPGRHELRKTLHVSPFLQSAGRYQVRWSPPGDQLRLAWDLFVPVGPGSAQGAGSSDPPGDRPEVLALRTRLLLRRQAVTRRALGQLLWRAPFQTHRVSAGIYRQALHLARSGAPFHPHPDPTRRWHLPGRAGKTGASDPWTSGARR
jgi:DUF1365 family protein